MKIGIDIMGGDFAPQKSIHGTVLALKELPENTEIFLFGKEDVIQSELSNYSVDNKQLNIINCEETISMGDHPTKSFKSKPNSSIAKGFKFLSENKIDGFTSAGNTGAMYVGGYYSVKAVTGILRPAISTIIPKENGGLCILLDVGANADCKPDVLYQFGILGSLFAKHVCNINNPKVSLLNLGEEETKGNMVTQMAHNLMKGSTDYDFIGNVEGTHIFNSDADVIVCDGFTGNIVLKEAEGIFSIMKKRGLLDEYFNRFNYETYGGTPVLGLNKTVIIGHGISNEIAIKNMIMLTKDVVNAKLADKLKETLI